MRAIYNANYIVDFYVVICYHINMTIQAFIPKEEPEMPDFYTVTITVFGGKPTDYKIVSHKFITAVYEEERQIDVDGKTMLYSWAYKGIHPSPYWEFALHENNELLCIPMSSATILFHSDWAKICELRNKKDESTKG